MKKNLCELAGKCSGCPDLKTPYQTQIDAKIKSFPEVFNSEIHFISCGEYRTRDRVDLTWDSSSTKPVLGLHDLNYKNILDLPACPQMTEPLEAWFLEFKKNLPSLKNKASVRLRVDIQNNKGVWLDLSHEDTKNLFEEKKWLTELLKKAFVEIGQRKKPLILSETGLKLQKEPIANPWFQTYLGEMLTPVKLYGLVGSFTQPGFGTNLKLVEQVLFILKEMGSGNILELFSGLGNFSIPLASFGNKVIAFEIEKNAMECFKKTISENNLTHLNIQLLESNLYNKDQLTSINDPLNEAEILFVDPPRSGMKNVVSKIKQLRPKNLKHILYVSCHTKTLIEDLNGLTDCGYEIQKITGVDQFPHTPHCEWVVWLKRK